MANEYRLADESIAAGTPFVLDSGGFGRSSLSLSELDGFSYAAFLTGGFLFPGCTQSGQVEK
jgi:hypothetical protein